MELYELSPEEKRLVRSCYGKDEEYVRQNEDEIKRWVKEQIQLPVEAQDGKFIELMLLRGKFDVERTKTKIENYFKHIRKYPELFTKLGQQKLSEEVCAAINMPKVTPAKCERIVVLKFSETTLKKFDVDRCIASAVSAAMVMYHNDYHSGIKFLIDCKGFSFFYMTKVTPRIMMKLLMIYEITLHQDLDSVHQNIPRECLPSDYGGDLNPSEYYLLLWDEIIESQAELYATISKTCQTTDASLDAEKQAKIIADSDATNNNYFKNLDFD